MKISVYDVVFRRKVANPTVEAFSRIAAGGQEPPAYRVAIHHGATVGAAVRVARSMQPSDGLLAGNVYNHVAAVTYLYDLELDPQVADSQVAE